MPFLALLLTALLTAPPQSPQPAAAPDTPTVHGLTAVPGVLVGHHTLDSRPTGCTVVIVPERTVGAVDVRGGAPGSREQALLQPENLVQSVNAVVLAGGSAFGLDAASGAVRWLEEHGHGYDTGVAKVPIVPAAILYDLAVGDPTVRPGADCGYRAAEAATGASVVEGNVGAGAGATVGKLAGPARAMKGGLGSEELRMADGLVVAALAAVNAVGTVVDPAHGAPVAGVRSEDGSRVLPPSDLLLRDQLADTPWQLSPVESTTLVVVATNARLTKTEATKVAQMAHDGLARAIVPVHTPFDGDTVFVLATGDWPPDSQSASAGEPAALLRIGSLAAEATAQAILRGVRRASGLPGLPSASDLATETTDPTSP